jgi:hypothetical protein
VLTGGRTPKFRHDYYHGEVLPRALDNIDWAPLQNHGYQINAGCGGPR